MIRARPVSYEVPERCFFCAHLTGRGHSSICPVGYPSKHHYKIIWWAAYFRGLAGKDESNTFTDSKDRDVHTMGWVQGTEALHG